jgi:formylglycine-generating enzyme required for sulfatase activity
VSLAIRLRCCRHSDRLITPAEAITYLPEAFCLSQCWLRRGGRTFALATHEVTVKQFLKFRQNYAYNRQYSPADDYPVNMLTLYDAAAYCNWLSQQEKIPRDQWCYEPNPGEKYAAEMRLKPNCLNLSGYRLPTEAEWEWACRAGARTSRYYGETEDLLGQYAWCTRNSQDRAMLPVGSLKPNDLGLFDILGNASEWTQDQVVYYGLPTDGKLLEDRPSTTEIRDASNWVMRGGSFNLQPAYVRCAGRLRGPPSGQGDDVGLRPARTLLLPGGRDGDKR